MGATKRKSGVVYRISLDRIENLNLGQVRPKWEKRRRQRFQIQIIARFASVYLTIAQKSDPSRKESNFLFDSMNSITASYSFDDKDLDDAALWAVIDSAAAASLSSARAATTSPAPRAKPLTPIPFPLNSPQPQFDNRSRNHRHSYNRNPDGEVVQNHRPHKIPRTTTTPRSSPQQLMVVKHVHRTPTTPPAYNADSTETRNFAVTNFHSPNASSLSCEKVEARHSLAGQFPTVSLFKEYQNAAMAILEKSDYTMISGNTYIKKSGWRKISFYFNLSYEIKDKTIEFDENRNVQRAEFIVRAYMQGGRFSDGWGSCERREKKFMKPNHDIPSTAETRAKNRACQFQEGFTNAECTMLHKQ
ncbi:peptide transporter family protein [Perilla frutescens var. frutescens]|nr:peptide transporter family protein [Perilla frutescens var. frutescens]